jgi:signal transduction histidine kinase
MKGPLGSLPLAYRKALAEHLANPGDATLQQALQIGRAALAEGLGLADIIRMHHEALGGLPAKPVRTAAARARLSTALDSFLLEALLPFGGAERKGDLMLETRFGHVEQLALRNGELEDEIAECKRAEAATLASKDHYFALYQNARAMEANLRDLAAQVLAVQEEERKRISRELHDEIGQALAAVEVSIAMLQKQAGPNPTFQENVAEAKRLLERTMETVHNFARELRPAMLDHLGLESAFRALLTTFERQTGISTGLVADPHVTYLDEKRGEVLFRVAQEALSNVHKHASATEVKVEFMSTADSLSMKITDNGRAFDVPRQARAKPNGRLGLIGMQERVRLVNGSLSITSAPARGTCVCAKIPLDPMQGEAAGNNASGRLQQAYSA